MKARVEELFHEVADLTPDARARYFAEHDVDEDTRTEVDALLAFDSDASGLLQRDIGQAANRALAQLEPTGSRCGPYRLLDRIGRGGMGTVYLAERIDGELVQRVAVKLVQPGAADFQRERFLQERQILASLEHPNIARLLDAGHLDDGQPFLVMEHVHGRPIDVYAAGLGVRQKIALFVKVCAAVGYLHRNLVIHRDLKPNNILVTSDGEPKLLDFGIAKILDLSTGSTVTILRMMTPDYASPEQVMGGKMSTATDIYSLGALLYHLLAGKPPHEFKESTPEEISSTIATRPVARPSRWVPALKGDIELILMKALRKDPLERYTSVEQFAEDLEAFLQSRPVRAHKRNLLYLARKTARRHWVPLAAAALVLAGLVLGLYAVNRERAMAQRRFNEVRQLSNKLFEIDRRVRQLPGAAQTRQLIVDTALEYLRRLSADAESDPDLALDVGAAYIQVGRVQGVPLSPNLGQMENAERSLRIAEELIASVLRAQPANRLAFLRSAEIAHDRMLLADMRRPRTGALPLAQTGEQWLTKYLAGGPVAPGEAQAVVIVGGNIAGTYVRHERIEECRALLRRTIEIAKATDQRREAGSLQMIVSDALRAIGDLEGALAAAREAATLVEPPPGETRVGPILTFSRALSVQGAILGQDNGISMGRPEAAAPYYERSYKIAGDLSRQDANDSYSRNHAITSGMALANILRHTDPRRALALYDEALRRMAAITNNTGARSNEARGLARSTYPLRQLGRSAEGRRRLVAALALLSEMKLYPAERVAIGSEPDEVLRALAEDEAGGGDVRKAIETYERLLRLIAASKPRTDTSLEDADQFSRLCAAIAALHRRAGQVAAASALETRRLDLWRHWERKLPNNAFVLRQIAESSR